jgi:hypothetical protein
MTLVTFAGATVNHASVVMAFLLATKNPMSAASAMVTALHAPLPVPNRRFERPSFNSTLKPRRLRK